MIQTKIKKLQIQEDKMSEENLEKTKLKMKRKKLSKNLIQ